MSKINEVANKVYTKLGGTKTQVVIDPATIAVIMSIVTQVIAALQECKKNKEAATTVVTEPTTREVKLLKRTIRKELGFRKYWREGERYVDALTSTGETLTASDIGLMYDEVK